MNKQWAYIAAITGGTVVCSIALLCGIDGFVIAGFFGGIGMILGWQLRGQREERKRKLNS